MPKGRIVTSSPFSLDGKIALVTGAGRGLGLEIAKGLAVAGARVLVNGRNLAGLARAVKAITSAGGSAAPLQFDIADERSASEVAAHLCQIGLEPVWKDWDPSILATTDSSPQSPENPVLPGATAHV